MDERTALLALCTEPAALVEPSGAVVATNERLQVEAGRDRPPATLDALLDRFAAGVLRGDEFRAAVAAAVRKGTSLRRYAAAPDPDADDVEILVVPERGGPGTASLVVVRLPNRHVRDEVLRQRHDRLSLLGQMMAESAHELNNVLTTVIGWSHLSAHPRSGADVGQLATHARHIEAAALKAQRIVADLMGVARGQGESPVANVAATSREVARMMAGECERRAIEVSIDVPDELEAKIRRYRLTQVLLNLVRNAVQALRQGGHVRLTGRLEDGWVALRVADDGPGMDAATQARVFEPFFTTRRGDGEESGTGLGLPLCRKIVEGEAGGSIRITSTHGEGTTVELRLPLSPLAELRQTGIRDRLPRVPDGFSLLAVERDPDVGRLIVESLKQCWNVAPVVVSGMESAIAALHARAFSVCLLDGDADPDGPAAAIDRVAALRAGVPVVLTSTGDSWAGVAAPPRPQIASELRKPFSVPELLAALAAAAGKGSQVGP
ncbi:MAG: HAMP domain-containing histidine kinase [Deltaproteobacteria bacterium]|nr:HAMP domain-containing histidine kinase [Deltaproteobacteria bacterium]